MIQKRSTLISLIESVSWELDLINKSIESGKKTFNGDSISIAKFHCERTIEFLSSQLEIYEIGEWECEILFKGSKCSEVTTIIQVNSEDSDMIGENDEDVFFCISSVDELYELQNPNTSADFVLISILSKA